MLKDITIGQFFPGDSVLHRQDPRFKLIESIIFIAMLFAAQNFTAIFVATLFAFFAYAVGKIKISLALKGLKPVLPLIIFSGVLNLFFITGGELLWQWQFISIYENGIETAVFMVVRVVALIAGMSLLTYTTSPIMLTDAIENLLAPLKKVKFPVHELAMMMTIALRFIPTLIEETDRIMSAQKARGAQLDTGSLKVRVKALVPVLVPLFVSAFKRASDLALAMECRCYRGGEGRTRLRTLKSAAIDGVCLTVTLVVAAAVIAVGFVPWII
ncbi:MAG: energy-coupling factor transporter transmembrane protein EcfT [Oscillospiraceae bacterium]|jgi:energy-coupling factor transport system permease protein|nr:energy-coupling factor transporter transmembrane protein EcfT [Oscillospiraceae bacterium]